MNDRYSLHKRLQEAAARANVSFRDFKPFHHVSYNTLYSFLKKPEAARDRTLTSVRIICDFLNDACNARLLPLQKGVDKPTEISRLYNKWWDNDRKFVTTAVEDVKNT